jgi:hypothetical protein
MTLFNKLFGKNTATKGCPRCLGKGHVDWADIKRLNQELKWTPGPCAYCNGQGKVDETMEANVPVDTTYLVNNLPEEERQKLFQGHTDAWARAKEYENQLDDFIAQICYLRFEAKLSPSQIAGFFLIGRKASDLYEREAASLLEYIETVIRKNSNENTDGADL